MTALPLKFDVQGLVPAIVQDHLTGDIRMFAYATETAVRKTLEQQRATFWSRSRGELWQKGRASGQVTPVVRVLADCDGDCLIYSSAPDSPSCHSGAPSCFFQAFEGERLRQASVQPQTVLGALEAEVDGSKKGGGARSVIAEGPAAIAAKVRAEAAQFAQALEREGDEQVVSEAADAIYQVVVGLRARSIPLRRVLAELSRRLTGDRRASVPAPAQAAAPAAAAPAGAAPAAAPARG
ncbi:MAG: bifunctional phosphoribosyl-AMP cyclohydrolase/phosphoribosyl-ATP diphosphatase HisIE [Myxococcales bacterium]|nr:bifunctional phosphoribosyl-AMP cyclohydrolase/phosphoribosyl-ATP diphosphatase HisIE [Myxococcales bacterium]